MRQQAQIETHYSPPEQKKKNFHQEGDQAEEQVAQGGYGVSFIFGDIKNPTGLCPEQPALADPA